MVADEDQILAKQYNQNGNHQNCRRAIMITAITGLTKRVDDYQLSIIYRLCRVPAMGVFDSLYNKQTNYFLSL